MPLMWVLVISGLFEFKKKILLVGGGVTLKLHIIQSLNVNKNNNKEIEYILHEWMYFMS